jgi:GAF domain
MSSLFNIGTSRLNPSSVAGPEDSHTATPVVTPGAFSRTLARLRTGLQGEVFDLKVFLSQVADQARDSTGAESIVVALRRQGTIVCLARSGAVGPVLGAPLDSTSGLTGECVRNGVALRCDDSENDSRVNAEVCRLLGVRSVAVVPILEGSEVAGLMEAFSARPNAFQDQHIAVLGQLALLIAESQKRGAENPSPPFPAISTLPPTFDRRSPLGQGSISNEKRRINWAGAWALRPYQIGIVVAFLLLDLLTIYWWQQR